MPTTVTSPTNSARTVTGLMTLSVLFALVGNEIQIAGATTPTQGQTGFGAVAPGVTVTSTGRAVGKNKFANGMDKGATIIVGGFIAAALLVALTGAGEAGRKFAVGLAVVTTATSLLVYGAPVWNALAGAVGGKPTGSTSSTKPTANTAPTSGTGTVVALSNLAG